jgi:hypothetical protein
VNAHAEQLQRHQAFRSFESRLHDALGDVRWLSASGLPQFDDDGHFVGYRGAGQDVTARRRAEEAVEQGHRLLREAVDNVASGFTIYDADDRLVICNLTYLDIYQHIFKRKKAADDEAAGRQRPLLSAMPSRRQRIRAPTSSAATPERSPTINIGLTSPATALSEICCRLHNRRSTAIRAVARPSMAGRGGDIRGFRHRC